MVEEHLKNLGLKATDRVTGFKGVITSISFDLYGCIQFVISPPAKNDGSHLDGRWFDMNRLEITSAEAVMSPPDFVQGPIAIGGKGCQIKPIPQ